MGRHDCPRDGGCSLNRIEAYTGGMLDTNAFLYRAPGGNILFDAPEGAAKAFSGEKIDMLILTHGHFDHVADAAAIKNQHLCPVVMHELTVPMVSDREFFRRWGFELEVEPVTPDRILGEGPCELLGVKCQIFHVPGHCPGSLCTYLSADGVLIGGDVLFAGGVGRWDLPGGDHDELIDGIKSKLLLLPPETKVLPGHGPATTIGAEARSNPFLE